MSRRHPIIAVTGSSGAGTTSVRAAFEHIFRRLALRPALVAGDAFHYYNRAEMHAAIRRAQQTGQDLSHFGPEANLFKKLESLFASYGQSGTGMTRRYIHDAIEAAQHPGYKPGEFTPWENLPADTDLLFYEGLHGGVVTEDVDVARHVDLLIGVAPIVNLEWIQKIHRDHAERGHSPEDSIQAILRRMPDYVHYITPQFSRTHINLQRVPTVDTTNPFIARDIPTLDESFVVIRFDEPSRFGIDFPYLLSMIHGSHMSRPNTVVVPGGKLTFAMEVIFTPIVEHLAAEARRAANENQGGI